MAKKFSILRISPHYFGFFGGVLISAAVGLLISILNMQSIAKKLMVFLSSISLICSGFFTTWIGWKTDHNLNTSINLARSREEKEVFLNDFIKRDKVKLISSLIISSVFAIIGFGLIAYIGLFVSY